MIIELLSYTAPKSQAVRGVRVMLMPLSFPSVWTLQYGDLKVSRQLLWLALPSGRRVVGLPQEPVDRFSVSRAKR